MEVVYVGVVMRYWCSMFTSDSDSSVGFSVSVVLSVKTAPL